MKNALTCHALISINHSRLLSTDLEHDESAHLTGFNRLELAGELSV